MATLADIRAKFPQYSDLSDQQLADSLYKKSYSDMPRADFDAKLGLTPPDPYGHQAVADNLSAGFTAGVNAIPLAGPSILHGMEWLKGLVQGRPQSDVEATDKAQMDTHPIAKTVGEFAGPAVALAPLGMTAIGARALGLSGNIASRIGLGAASGGALAGSDAYVRTGGDVGAAENAALMGAGVGGALPAAGRIIRNAWRGVTGNTFDSAAKPIARALQSDQIPVADVPNRLAALGPDAVMADLGPNLQRQAGALASLPGEAQQTVRNALEARAENTNTRIQGDTNTILGPAPVPAHLEAGIRGNMDALAPEYRAVFNNARAVDTTPIANNLDADIVNLRGDAQRAVRQVRGMLDLEGVPGTLDPNPGTLFQTRQAIDGMLEQEPNSKVVAALTRTRQQIDAMLAQAVPGLKAVDAKFEELANQSAALGTGQQALDSGRTAIRPAELQAEMAQSAVPERGVGPSAVPFRITQGARAEIDRIIGTTANNLNALKTALKGDGSWNRDRLVTLFGQDRADQLLAVLDRERRFDATNRIVTQNSETAGRQAAQAEFDTASPSGVRGMTATGLIASALQKVANVGARTRRGATNRRVAEALMSPGLSPRMSSQVAAALQDAQRRGLIPPAAVADALYGNGGKPTGLKIGADGKYAFDPASY